MKVISISNSLLADLVADGGWGHEQHGWSGGNCSIVSVALLQSVQYRDECTLADCAFMTHLWSLVLISFPSGVHGEIHMKCVYIGIMSL